MSLIEHADFDQDPRKVWLATEHRTAEQHAYYIILRGVTRNEVDNLDILRRLKAAFGPVTNNIKRINGRREYDTLFQILTRIYWISNKYLPVSDEQASLIRTQALELRKMIHYRV